MKLSFFPKMMLGIAAALAMTSCVTDDDTNYAYPNPNVGYGVLVNASPNSGDLYFYADQNLVNQNPLLYTTAQGFYGFYTGNRQLSIKNTAGATLAQDSLTVAQNDYFTAFAVNTFDNIELKVYRDSLYIPDAGKVLLRFINLSPDAPSLSVEASSNAGTLTEGLTFKEDTGFMSVNAGTYTFDYVNDETNEIIFSDSTQVLTSGKIYTYYTKGFVTPPAGSNDTFGTKQLRYN